MLLLLKFDKTITDYGLSRFDIRALQLIALHPCTAAGLAEKLRAHGWGARSPQVYGVAAKLANRGLITAARSQTNYKRKVYKLAPAGLAMLAAINKSLQTFLNSAENAIQIIDLSLIHI